MAKTSRGSKYKLIFLYFLYSFALRKIRTKVRKNENQSAKKSKTEMSLSPSCMIPHYSCCFVVKFYNANMSAMHSLIYDSTLQPDKILRDVRGFIEQTAELRGKCTSIQLLELKVVATKDVVLTKTDKIALCDQ